MCRALAGCFFVLMGAIVGFGLSQTTRPRIAQAADTAPSDGLLADVKTLQDKAVDQSHVMVSVAYHFNNLWFAAKSHHWALAEFYWNETRSHLRWAVRVIPIRKDNAGREVNLPGILEAMENTPLTQLKDAITAKDHERFEAAYKFSLETCYACHKAADKPYLRPRMPDRPAEPMMNFDPEAKWPL